MEGGFTETLTKRLYERLFNEEVAKLKEELGENYNAGRFPEAAQIFTETATAEVLPDFLTIPAYNILEN
jgi:malate synthase